MEIFGTNLNDSFLTICDDGVGSEGQPLCNVTGKIHHNDVINRSLMDSNVTALTVRYDMFTISIVGLSS